MRLFSWYIKKLNTILHLTCVWLRLLDDSIVYVCWGDLEQKSCSSSLKTLYIYTRARERECVIWICVGVCVYVHERVCTCICKYQNTQIGQYYICGHGDFQSQRESIRSMKMNSWSSINSLNSWGTSKDTLKPRLKSLKHKKIKEMTLSHINRETKLSEPY